MPLKAISLILEEVKKDIKGSTPQSVPVAVELIDSYEGGWWAKRRLRKLLKKVIEDLKGLVTEQVLNILKTQIFIFEEGEYAITPLGEIRKLSRSRQIFDVEIDKLRFYQDYVQKETIQRKSEAIRQLQMTYSAFKKTSPALDIALEQLPFTIPIVVSNIFGTDLYLVHNGVHTVYTYNKHGLKKIEAGLELGQPVVKNKKEYITLNDIRLE
jgi:hypothetical protein